ncbi:MAG: type II toxin-antitoxin system RelE/ParE family toxin [Janthinobacterium lividum]
MRDVVWSDDALQEFNRALTDIALEDERAATLVADRVEAAIDLLAERAIGRPGRVSGTYEKRVLRTSYVIAYALSEQTLTILRVIHGHRDWVKETWPKD